MIARLVRLHRDRGAQGLAFAAITLFVLVCFVATVANVSGVLAARAELQGAADASAYSAAVVRAQGLSAIAAMNHVMVWLARAALALVAAVIVLGVLVALNAVAPGAFAWAVPLFQQAVKSAVEWIPKLRKWSDRLARAEDQVARTAPLLAFAEADRIARADGASRGLLMQALKLPVHPEPSTVRYLDRVTGGAVPAWAFGRLFGGGEGSYSRSHTREEGSGRFRRTRTDTKSDRDIGQGVPDAATRGRLGEFRRIMEGFRKSPWPMPRVLHRGFEADTATVAAFPREGLYRARILPDRFAEPRAWPFLATARPFHPALGPEPVDARDNLYLVEGWSAELVPVDMKIAGKLGLDRGRFPWIEH